jgi:hypothetical protein
MYLLICSLRIWRRPISCGIRHLLNGVASPWKSLRRACEIWVCDVTRRFGTNSIPPHTLGGWFDAIEGALQRIRNDPPLRKAWRFAECVRDEVWKQAGRETVNDNEGDAEQGDGVRRDRYLDSMIANAAAVAKEGVGVVN